MDVIKGDSNELWKFLNYLFNVLRVINYETQAFEKVLEVLRIFGSKLVTTCLGKTKQVF